MSTDSETIRAARDLIRNFLQKSGIRKQPILTFDPDRTVEQRVREAFQLQDMPPDKYEKHLRTALAIGTTAYAHCSIEVQVYITAYTLITTSIDDFDQPCEATEQFVMRFITGQPQLTPSLETLADILRCTPRYYSPHATSGIITSTLEFINATLLEKDVEHLAIGEGAENYAIYTRFKNGVAQAYGLFIWDRVNFPDVSSYAIALPDAMVFVNYVNDILSFYKEEIEGDYQNVVHSRALARKDEVTVVLSDIVDEVTASIARCRAILPDREARAWEEFMSGYLTFHYLAPRYRLQEIIAM